MLASLFIHTPQYCPVCTLRARIVSDNREFILQDSAMTGENGFFDLYLPKGKDYIATFTVENKSGVGIITTKEGSSNCITEIQVG